MIMLHETGVTPGLDSTYEGLKLRMPQPLLDQGLEVWTVPMRA